MPVFPILERSTAVIFGGAWGIEGGSCMIERIPRGDHAMNFEMRGKNDETRKYYHPGTFDREKAGIIKFALGTTKSSSVRIKLPENMPVRIVTGQVTAESASKSGANFLIRLSTSSCWAKVPQINSLVLSERGNAVDTCSNRWSNAKNACGFTGHFLTKTTLSANRIR